MSTKRSARPWQSAAALCPSANSARRSSCLCTRGTPSASVPCAQGNQSRDSDGSPRDARVPWTFSGNELRSSEGEGTANERRRTAGVEDSSRATSIVELPISRADSRGDAMRNAEGLQTILCAQLLSSLAKGNASQNVTAPWQKEMTDDAVALRAKIYDDPEVNDFTCRLNNFSKNTGITPPVVLSYVMNESVHSMPGNSKDVSMHADQDGQLNHVLFDLLWHQHVSCDSPLSVGSNRGGALSMTSPEGVTGKSQEGNGSCDQKRTTRQEALQRWMKKREKRSFSARIRYPARQHLANARKRHKGQFVSNKESAEDVP